MNRVLASMTVHIQILRRPAYVEALSDEKGPATAGFLMRALAFFRALDP